MGGNVIEIDFKVPFNLIIILRYLKTSSRIAPLTGVDPGLIAHQLEQ